MASPQEKIYTEEDYYSLPEYVRAELIDGQFYNMSAPNRFHQEILMELSATIRNYIKEKGGSCHVYPAPFAVKLFNDKKTVVEPDISVICDTKKLTDKGCSGAPDWIIEIVSPSNASHDYITKLVMYHSAGVREYWIVDPQNDEIHVYNMADGAFATKTYSFHDTVKAGIYDDLSMAGPAGLRAAYQGSFPQNNATPASHTPPRPRA